MELPVGLMSATREVPAAMPSDLQSSVPLAPSSARKYSVPSTLRKAFGYGHRRD